MIPKAAAKPYAQIGAMPPLTATKVNQTGPPQTANVKRAAHKLAAPSKTFLMPVYSLNRDQHRTDRRTFKRFGIPCCTQVVKIDVNVVFGSKAALGHVCFKLDRGALCVCGQ